MSMFNNNDYLSHIKQADYEYQKAMMNQVMQSQMNIGQQGTYTQTAPPTLEQMKKQWEDAQMRADNLRVEYEKKLRVTPMKGPSPAQCTEFPSLKEAWDNLKMIMKLTGTDNEK